eukprot:jgi/Hompol1/5214/HPOL_001921-RA
MSASKSKDSHCQFAVLVEAGAMLAGVAAQFHIECCDMPSLDAFKRAGQLQRQFSKLVHPQQLMDTSTMEALLEEFVLARPLTLDPNAFSAIYRAISVRIDRRY